MRRWILIASRWVRDNQTIISNAGSIVATTAATSGLGFVYWWLAIQFYPEHDVGVAAAAVSAMSLLGTLGMLGFGTLLMGELPRQPERARPLIATALVVSGGLSLGLGALAAVVAPWLSADLRPLSASPAAVALFALGVSLTAATLVLDQALIGLLRGNLQLWRNVLFSVAKLLFLGAAGLWLSRTFELTIFATWVLGIVVSLAVLAAAARRGARSGWRVEWGLIRTLRRAALGHHALNLALFAPGMVLPLIVTAQLSAATNASFYAAWMIANLVYIGPASLSMVLYAVGAADTALLAQKTRFTLRLAAIGGVLAVLVLQISAPWLLTLFRPSYAEQAAACLRILSLGVFPLIIKDHYVAICRVQGRIAPTALLLGVLGVFELGAAAIGAQVAGLSGLSIGWVAAMLLGTLLMGRTVWRTARGVTDNVITDRLATRENAV